MFICGDEKVEKLIFKCHFIRIIRKDTLKNISKYLYLWYDGPRSVDFEFVILLKIVFSTPIFHENRNNLPLENQKKNEGAARIQKCRFNDFVFLILLKIGFLRISPKLLIWWSSELRSLYFFSIFNRIRYYLERQV